MVDPRVLEDVFASDLVDDPNRSAASEPARAEVTAVRRRRWGRQASLTAVTLGAIGGFVALSRLVSGAPGNRFDHAVVRWVGRARHAIGNGVFIGLTSLGSVGGVVGVSLVAIALSRRSPRVASQIVAGSLGGVVAELLLKRFFRRARPTLLVHLEDVRSTSFPSGHAMASSSLYLTLAFVASRSRRLRGHRRGLLAGAGAVAGSVGASRVYLGVHWPTDVLGGLALGTAWACAAEAVFDLTGAERVRAALASSHET